MEGNHRPLDQEESRVFDAVRAGADEALTSDAASLAVRWQEFEGVSGLWPVFVLTPSGHGPPQIGFWLWPNQRMMGNAAIAALSVGDIEAGILVTVTAPDEEKLAASVTHCTKAFVEGHAVFNAKPAEPDEYDDAILPEALTIWVTCKGDRTTQAARGYIEDPQVFRRVTGIAIGDHLGSEHPFAAFLKH